MIILDLFFLLLPGEYTATKLESTPFHICDAGPCYGQRLIYSINTYKVTLNASTFKNSNSKPTYISNTLRTAVTFIIPSLGLKSSDVSTRYLQSTSTMDLLCNGVNSNIIKMIRLWRLDEMLLSLHVHAKPILKNFSSLSVRHGVYNLLKSATNEVPCY